ncbi:GNAT family N-acetyltransferase [Streptococcus pneumoniae]
MPIPSISQPEMLFVSDGLRLRAYDGQLDLAYPWYQDTDMVYLLDAVGKPYSHKTIQQMYEFLSHRGEVYFIEVDEAKSWKAIGDVAFWQEDLPIVIGEKSYRGCGIGRAVVKTLIERARELGFDYLRVQEIYEFNVASKALFTSLGFQQLCQTDKGYSYELPLMMDIR